jgi:23S rRNA pseudouridine2457 synthase
MARILIFNKPYGILCQFRPVAGQQTLADFIAVPGIYPAGRLDKDSEGLLLLTDDGALQHRISHPRHKLWKTYWVQVEGDPGREQLEGLRRGPMLGDGPTQPARVLSLAEPDLWPRDPPIRSRGSVPTTWLEIGIREGRNRQVRRMTAAVGLPTLRLIRVRIGPWGMEGLGPGDHRWLEEPGPEPRRSIKITPPPGWRSTRRGKPSI